MSQTAMLQPERLTAVKQIWALSPAAHVHSAGRQFQNKTSLSLKKHDNANYDFTETDTVPSLCKI